MFHCAILYIQPLLLIPASCVWFAWHLSFAWEAKQELPAQMTPGLFLGQLAEDHRDGAADCILWSPTPSP